ncbi:MAG TPA: ABC transporter ATP-binding protein [Symbiobacteriaceae bacterium]|nr:ABC transporter ATP-binding protein [Symbiobacteriaceae bacterium]
MLLECHRITKRFGGLTAVKDLDLSIKSGEILGLIGPNGAGKTTAFNMISGVAGPDSGRISLRGKEMTGARSYQMARSGVCRTFQNPRLFGRLSVLDNVMVAAHAEGGGLWSRIRGVVAFDAETRERARASLAFVGLEHREQDQAADLPYGHLRKLELARALAGNPALILLDEPVAGMNPTEIGEFMTLVRRVIDRGISVLLIEHHMQMVMGVCERVIVLNFGEKLAEGTPAEVGADPGVIAAYLGEGYLETAQAAGGKA